MAPSIMAHPALARVCPCRLHDRGVFKGTRATAGRVRP